MKKIILDTSFLVSCAEFKIDLFSELNRICLFNFDLFIIDKSLLELEVVGKKSGKHKSYVKLVMLFLKKGIKCLPSASKKHVDNIILDTVNKDEYVVATQDAELKRRLKQKNIPIITIRKKHYLILEE